jgi:hypothetical protein
MNLQFSRFYTIFGVLVVCHFLIFYSCEVIKISAIAAERRF